MKRFDENTLGSNVYIYKKISTESAGKPNQKQLS